MRVLAATLLSAFLSGQATASAGAPPDHAQDAVPPKPVDELAQEIEDSLFGRGCAENLPKLVELTARPDFEAFLHPRRQATFLIHVAMCLGDEGRFEAALDYANRAAAADPTSFSAQGVRLQLGMIAGKPLNSVDAFDALSRLRPEFIRRVDSYRIRELVVAANRSDPSGGSALRVFEAMERAAWRPAPLESDDSIRVDHARLLAEVGRIEEARKQLEPVSDLSSLVEIRVDRRFDSLRRDPAFEARLDLAAGIAHSLARANDAMEGNPRQLQAAYLHAAALIAANRHADALHVLNTSLKRLLENPGAFDDGNAAGPIRNLMSAQHYEVGAFDDGRAQFQELVLDLAGNPFEASARMTFARFLIGEGRARQALDVLSSPGPMSPAGEAEAESYRFCARVQLGNVSASESLEHLAAGDRNSADALSRALLCLGDLDRLAELTIRLLRDPDSRRDALLSLQSCPATAFDELPFMKLLADRVAVLLAREDVREAVQAFGRIESVPVRLRRLY